MKKGFTLVELLAVIVILAVILVIAVPKITDIIDSTKKSSMEASFKIILDSAEKEYTTREMLGTLDQTNDPIECADVTDLSDDYDKCFIEFNNGVPSLTLVGKNKFDVYQVTGTKDNINTIKNSSIYSEPILNGAYPNIDEGMIPVTIANDGTVTAVNPTNKWYSYKDKEWANAVLVKDIGVHTRDYYKTNYGVVDSSDILAYFVWIPRYRYKLFNVNGNVSTYTDGVCTSNCPISIEIIFENANTNKSNGTTNGTYLTHPGFTYDGNELNGIWVGKFETTGSDTTPTILPNVSSLRNQNVSTQFETSLKFKNYGLNTESRMMKNSDWGAVAYLSHSTYGINDEVRINNNNGYKTGCGASTIGGESTGECQIQYGKVSAYPQSTTGNISGIFDMSGGAWEYVMGVLGDSTGKGRSGLSGMSYTKEEWITAMQKTEADFASWYGASATSIGEWNSGYNGLTYIPAIGSTTKDSYYKTNGKDFPNSKYYKIYNATNWTKNKEYFGEALGEIQKWYSDYNYFVGSDVPWFLRGGYYGFGASGGLFSFYYDYGRAQGTFSFRSVL